MKSQLFSFWLGLSHTIVVFRHLRDDTDTAGMLGVAVGMFLLFGIPASILTALCAR